MSHPHLRTYSHLAPLGRPPTEYELVTTRLLPYLEHGFEVRVPLEGWYRQHQAGSRWSTAPWERFHDPRETTYTRYTALQARQETHADELLLAMERPEYDAGLSADWLRTLEQVILPLRYPFHGLQMVSSYVAQMAPASRVTIAALFQTADEIRRIQRLAYRMAQLRQSRPRFAENSRMLWQEAPVWQPLRQLVERLLITFDWAEAFVVLNVVLKPLLDSFVLSETPPLARAGGDGLLGDLFASLAQDCRWHHEWTGALISIAVSGGSENRALMQNWVNRSYPVAREAMSALASLMGAAGMAALERAESTAQTLWGAWEIRA
jgi:toluene monooxygenase system protein E